MIGRFLTLIHSTLILAACAVTTLAQESNALEASVELSDGTQLNGILWSVDSDVASLEIDGDAKTFSVKQINQIQLGGSSESPPLNSKIVALIDGSRIHCSAVTLDGRTLKATTETGVEFSLQSRLVDFVRFSAEDDIANLWADAIKLERTSDALMVVRDQKLQAIEGVIGSVSKKEVSFTVGERTAGVRRDRLSGMLFYRRGSNDYAPPFCVLSTLDESIIQVRSIAVKDGKFEVNSVAGLSITIAPDTVSRINFAANRSVWLTDLDPATNDWSPLISSQSILGSLKQFSIARMDKSFSGKTLTVLTTDPDSGDRHQEEHSKGFAIKGGGKLSFLLAKQYRQLKGLVAFDPEANATGKVKFIVQVDGTNRIEEVLDASAMQKPLEVDVDLDGADRIVFQVDYFDRRSVGDILHAVDMQLGR